MEKPFTYFLTWLGLLAFLALTCASAYVPLGPWNTAINMAISCAKGLLVALFFMHLKKSGALLRIAALTGLAFLGILFVLSYADYATRDISPAAWAARP
ncbi:MAG TPA: cytochrome C oxidase subunit IV family protein [Burkholderiales bacterium]|nr:cytochrome C oxidase subunit IV family protein [Burkholderiales bacterium]